MTTQRTVALPVLPDASWALAWSGKYDSDILPYQIDCTDWLANGGFTVASVDVSASANLVISQLTIGLSNSNSLKLISLSIGGGSGGATAQVGITLSLVGGYRKYVLISLPVLQSVTGLISVVPASGGGSTSGASSSGANTSTLLTVIL